MKLRLFTIIGLSCLLSATVAAQDYDDIYYDSSQQQEKVAARVEEPEPAVTTTVHDDDVIADYYTADQVPQGWEDNVVDLRNVDEYNRHIGSGDLLAQNAVGDTVGVDSTIAGGGDAFQYTERIRRFHNPDVIAESEDSDAVDLYVYTRPDVNIIVGTPTTAYVSPWGATVSFNTWGWGLSVYDPWFDPWYYDPWYYRPYWYYSSWYRPYWGWGWGGPYYAYHHHHHYHGGWWAPAPSRRYTAGGRRLYANTGHRGYAAGTTRSGSRRVAAGAGTRRQLAQTGRVGGSSQSVRRQAVTSANATRRLNGSSAIANNSINRYKARVNRVNASTSKFTTGNRVGAVTSNRVNLAMDWYTRNNYDLIGIANTPGTGGTVYEYANVASMKSHGFELTLSTKNVKTKDFSWNTDFIFSKTKNEVTELDTRASMMDLISGTGFALEGYPVRGLFSIPFVGLDKDGIPMFNIDGQITSTDIDFQRRDNLGFLKYEGPTDPTITGSFGNIFTYKGFKLNVFLTYSFGNVVRLDPVFKAYYTDLSSMPREFKNRWAESGDEAITTIPAILSKGQYEANKNLTYAYNAYNYSSERIAKGDFIRLKEISLMYDFPKAWIEPLKVSSLSLKVQATNLMLLYADKKLNGQDPEFFNTGGVASPVPKQFTFTLRLGI